MAENAIQALQRIERTREIERGIETYRRQDIRAREVKEIEEFVANDPRLKDYVLRAQKRAYSRYAGAEPKIDVVV